MSGDISKAQNWFRSLSDGLDASFRGSAQIAHSVTKGETRETQILDVLRLLVPSRASIEHNVVIVDHQGHESPKFDGVALDRDTWPLLFAQDDLQVAMIESVIAAFEIKSSLSSKDLRDVCDKAAKLRKMTHVGMSPPRRPVVTAFAYDSPNVNLAFFDFCQHFYSDPLQMPTAVCVLNVGIFCFALNQESFTLVDQPDIGLTPNFMRAGRDTLLSYLYFVSNWITPESLGTKAFITYSQNFFGSVVGFYFDDDFVHLLQNDGDAAAAARKCFKAEPDVATCYATAREVLGLPSR